MSQDQHLPNISNCLIALANKLGVVVAEKNLSQNCSEIETRCELFLTDLGRGFVILAFRLQVASDL